MVLGVGIADFTPLHVHLHNTEAGIEIGIDAINGEAVDGFVLRHGLTVKGGDIGDITVLIHQVDVSVLIDNQQALGLLIPGNEVDVGIVEAIHPVVDGNGVVVQMILVQVVGCFDKQRVATLDYLLGFSVGHIGAPSADLCSCRACE